MATGPTFYLQGRDDQAKNLHIDLVIGESPPLDTESAPRAPDETTIRGGEIEPARPQKDPATPRDRSAPAPALFHEFPEALADADGSTHDAEPIRDVPVSPSITRESRRCGENGVPLARQRLCDNSRARALGSI